MSYKIVHIKNAPIEKYGRSIVVDDSWQLFWNDQPVTIRHEKAYKHGLFYGQIIESWQRQYCWHRILSYLHFHKNLKKFDHGGTWDELWDFLKGELLERKNQL